MGEVETPELSDIDVLTGIRDICREAPDGLAAWRAYRIRFGENRIAGKSSSDREQAFLGMYQAYTKYPAQFTMDLRMAKVKSFMRALAEAFLRTDVSEHDVENWFNILEGAQTGPHGVRGALARLTDYDAALAYDLMEKASAIWPELKPESPVEDSAIEGEVRDET